MTSTITTPFSSSADFPTWDGKEITFRFFFESTRVRAKQTETRCGTITGWLYTANEFTALPYAIAELGDNPIYAALIAPPVPDVNTATPNEMAMYKINLAEYHLQESEFRAFTTPFMAALPPHVVTDLESHFNTSLVNIGFHQVLARLRAKYGTISNEVLKELHDQLLIPFRGEDDLSTFVHRQVQVHNELNFHGFPLNQHDKIEKLKAALAPCGHFQLAFTLFHDAHRDPLRATFAEFVDTMKANQKAYLNTSTSAGYASSV